MDMPNALGINFAADMQEAINDMPIEIVYAGFSLRVSGASLTFTVETMDGGSKDVPGMSFTATLADFTEEPVQGRTLEYNGVTMRIITVQKYQDNVTVNLKCAYKDD